MPRVSIVVPTHNRLPQLKRAVASALSQTHGDRELIVVDDASSDGTADWLADQPALRAVRAAGAGGAGAARNRGIEQATGDFVAFLDDDDTWHTTYLERQVATLSSHPRAALSFAGHIEVAADGSTRQPDTVALMPYSCPVVRMLAEGFIHTMSVVMCRRRVFDSVGTFDEALAIVQDYDWYARLLVAGETIVPLSEVLVKRAVPGGLVTRHHAWVSEERRVVEKVLASARISHPDAQLVRAYRSLFFAHLAFARGDVRFGMANLLNALQISPIQTTRIAARRLARRFGQTPNVQSDHGTPS